MKTAAIMIVASAMALIVGSWQIESVKEGMAPLPRTVSKVAKDKVRSEIEPSEIRRLIAAQSSVERTGADVIRPMRSDQEDLTWFGINIADPPDRLVTPMLGRYAHDVFPQNKGCMCPTGVKGARNPTPARLPLPPSTDLTLRPFGTWTGNGIIGNPDGSRTFYVSDQIADVHDRHRRTLEIVAGIQKRFGLDRSAEMIRNRHGEQFIVNFSRIGSNDLRIESDAIDLVALMNSKEEGTITLMVRTRLVKKPDPRQAKDPTQAAFDAIAPASMSEFR